MEEEGRQWRFQVGGSKDCISSVYFVLGEIFPLTAFPESDFMHQTLHLSPEPTMHI